MVSVSVAVSVATTVPTAEPSSNEAVEDELPEELTDLLGYTMGNYALGYYAEPKMVEGMPDTLPPEVAIGRMPRKRKKNPVAPVGENAE